MQYDIPLSKADKLEALIAKYSKKGGVFTFKRLGETLVDGTVSYVDRSSGRPIERSVPVKVKCVTVEVEGSYVINGWQFVGTIEFLSAGNVIRLADREFEGKVPERYRHASPICEHCGTTRARKDCYLIHNAETDEWKQVGRNCLMDYTHGMDAELCASIMELQAKFLSLCANEYDADSFMGDGYHHTNVGIPFENAFAKAYGVINRFGYAKAGMGDLSTKERIRDAFFTVNEIYLDLKKPSEEELNEFRSYAKSCLSKQGDFWKNASTVCLSEYVEARDFGLLGALINCWLSDIAKAKARALKAKSEFVGNVGDRISVEVKSARTLYVKPGYGYYSPDTYVNEIVGTDGNVYVWSSQTCVENEFASWFDEEEDALILTATVKEHSEYKGVKQTVVTRGRLEHKSILAKGHAK